MQPVIFISIIAACYAVALTLELARLVRRVPERSTPIIVATAAGLVVQTVHLMIRASQEMSTGIPLSNWYDWCLMVAWLLAAVYLFVSMSRQRTAIGLFMLPAVLGLVGLAWAVRGSQPAPTEQAQSIWIAVHALALLMGTAMVVLGFLAGMMYLVQSWRLKNKLQPRPGFRLPSLEWLQVTSERALISSCGLMASGVLAGVVLNLIHRHQGDTSLPWNDWAVISSSLLFLWVVVAGIFNALYRPARQGRKIAYLTMANFGFLMLVLALLMFGNTDHAPKQQARSPETAAALLLSPAESQL